jgi:hypothetical protein
MKLFLTDIGEQLPVGGGVAAGLSSNFAAIILQCGDNRASSI